MYPFDERKNREDCIRGTVERSRGAESFTEAEVDHAVNVGMKYSDGSGRVSTWREIADAGIAAVKANRER
jgi:hypothetical protein